MVRTRARHAEICDAIARGLTITQISRTLRLDRKRVRRYASAATPDQLVPDTRVTRPGLLGPHLTYLHQRWDEGCRSTDKLNGELRARAYRGSLRTLRRHTTRLRQDTAPPAPPPAPAAKKVASLDTHPARQTLRRSPRRAHPDHRPVRGTDRHPRPGPRVRGHALPPPTASTWKPGPARPKAAPSANSAASPKDSARTGPPSPPGSPCLTAPASSKATSTASR